MYGASKSLYNLIIHLHKNQLADCSVTCRNDGPFVSKMKDAGIPIRIVPFELWVELWCKTNLVKTFLSQPWYFLKKYYRLLLGNANLSKKIISELSGSNFDLVYSNTIVMDFGWKLSRKLKVKHLWHIRETMLDHGIKPLFPFIWRTVKRSDKILLISEYQKKLLALHDAVIIPNPVEEVVRIQELSNRALQRKIFETGDPTFCIIGHITPNKGQKDAIRALGLISKAYPKARLTLVGNGSAEEIKRLKEIALNLGIQDKLTFTGFLDNTYEVLLESDASLVCSREEAFGRVTIESIICRKPVIGFCGGATPELLGSDGSVGVLYNTVEELAEIMVRFIENPMFPQRIANKAFETIGMKYSTQASAEAVLAEINRMLN